MLLERRGGLIADFPVSLLFYFFAGTITPPLTIRVKIAEASTKKDKIFIFFHKFSFKRVSERLFSLLG